jgi:hypothetical protein
MIRLAAALTIAALPGPICAQSLPAALAMARPGDVVKLPAGAYPPAKLQNLSFDPPVTVIGPGAVIQGLELRGVTGLTFRGLDFAAPPNKPYPFVIYTSKNLVFDADTFHGYDTVSAGLLIRNSSFVTVRHSEFSHLATGINHIDDVDLLFDSNNFHDIQVDGVRGGGSSRVTVKDNHFTDFYSKPGDHSDAIQFWTTNTKASATDIAIIGNVFQRGAGLVIQGIFLRDEIGTLPFQRVEITGNTILGGMYNGIAVVGGKDVVIAHNTVIGFRDMQSWIRVQGAGFTLSHNKANSYVIPPGVAEERGDETVKQMAGSPK